MSEQTIQTTNKANSQSTNQLYKGRYVITFYDKTGDEFMYMFNNVKEILEFKKIPVTKNNMHKMYITLYNILRKGTENNICTFLTGEKLRIYLIDI